MKIYMLDTDISSYIIRNRPQSVRDRFHNLDNQQLCISVITEAELWYGVRKLSPSSKTLHNSVKDFINRLNILVWDTAAAQQYAVIRARLEKTGSVIGNMDMLIAAHAMSLNATLVTNNHKHYQRVTGLTVENWL